MEMRSEHRSGYRGQETGSRSGKVAVKTVTHRAKLYLNQVKMDELTRPIAKEPDSLHVERSQFE